MNVMYEVYKISQALYLSRPSARVAWDHPRASEIGVDIPTEVIAIFGEVIAICRTMMQRQRCEDCRDSRSRAYNCWPKCGWVVENRIYKPIRRLVSISC